MTAFNGHMALYQHKRDMYDTVWSITLGSRGKLQRGKRINDGKRRMTILYLGGPVWECDRAIALLHEYITLHSDSRILNVSVRDSNVLLVRINNMQLLNDIILLILVLSQLNTNAVRCLDNLSRYEVKLAKS